MLNDFAPKYLSDLVDIYVPEPNLRSAQSQQLVQPAYNLRTYGFRAFSRASPFLWNSLSREIRFSSSLKGFLKPIFLKGCTNRPGARHIRTVFLRLNLDF